MTFTGNLPVFWLSSSGSVFGMKPHGRGFDPAHANIFITVSYLLQFSVYCNMQLIQINIYFNHHVRIFMLSYITRYSHL